MGIAVQLIEKDKVSGDLEEHITKQLIIEKGLSEEDVENETDEYFDAVSFMDLEWIDFDDQIEEDAFDNMMVDLGGYATNENIESFKTFVNLISGMNYIFYDNDLNHLGADEFVELIHNAVESSKEVMIDWVYYFD